MIGGDALRAKYGALSGLLDERSFRLCLAGDAVSLGRGGISQVAKASGVSRTTIHAGIRDLLGVSVWYSPRPRPRQGAFGDRAADARRVSKPMRHCWGIWTACWIP